MESEIDVEGQMIIWNLIFILSSNKQFNVDVSLRNTCTLLFLALTYVLPIRINLKNQYQIPIFLQWK